MKSNSVQVEALQHKVCESGRRLLSENLVARSWGNVSIRVDEVHCLITPSGRLYSDLTPQEIVLVEIANNQYEGTLKPSSEVDLHTRIYRERPAVGAIIHTHQPQASAVAAARCDVPVTAAHRQLLGSVVACARYALPSTKKLVDSTFAALADRPAVLLANHGVVCVGADIDQAFLVAQVLEQLCRDYVWERFKDSHPQFDAEPQAAMHDAFLKMNGVTSL